MGVNHAVRFTQNAKNLFVSPLPGSTIFLDDEVVTDKMTKMLEDGSRLRFAKSEYVLISEGFCPLPFLPDKKKSASVVKSTIKKDQNHSV